jgi:hypothetical protein
MPFNDTRLGPGTLTLGTTPGTEYGFQVSKLALTPSVDSTDGTPTLALPDPPPELKTTWALEGSAINDFTDPTGLQRYCFDHDGEETEYTWTPITAGLPTPTIVTGTVVLAAFPMGGDVGAQIVTDFSWPHVGLPVFSGGTTAAAAAGAKAKS